LTGKIYQSHQQSSNVGGGGTVGEPASSIARGCCSRSSDQTLPEFESFFCKKYCKSALGLLQTYPMPTNLGVAGLDVPTELLE
jgi:hypothetical protein